MTAARWPELHYAQWSDTQQTLQLWTQIVGKIRLEQTPMLNHWWNVTLYVTARGLTTSAMPYGDGRLFSIEFDFIDQVVRIEDSDGQRAGFPLEPMSVAEFYSRLMAQLQHLNLPVTIVRKPNEVADAIAFDQDTKHHDYDPAYAQRFWRALLQADRLCNIFRAEFIGKSSPVHFFWGSFDLAVTRYSGRLAPKHPGGFPNLPDSVTRESYSHEEFSVGFWPGGNGLEAAFYAYAYPEPPGLVEASISPKDASWNTQIKEFVLPYEAVRTADDPDRAVLDFFSSTYDAAADLAHWDRAALER